jgi:Fe2+ or Zn2+ uptake regulation protein
MTLRLTKHRQDIMSVLTHSQSPLSASEISTKLPKINLVTIYRNLEAFVAAGTIKKLHLGDTEAKYEVQETPHHHALCLQCDLIRHITLDEAKLKKIIAIPNFTITDLEITVRGHCMNEGLQKKPRTKA